MDLQLNFNKPENYAFFCPVSKLHLTRGNPVGSVNEVTPHIKRALKSKTLLDITPAGQKDAPKEEPKNQDINLNLGDANPNENSALNSDPENTSNEEEKSEPEHEEQNQQEKQDIAPRRRGRGSSKK